MSVISKQIEELRNMAEKWRNPICGAKPYKMCGEAADTIEALSEKVRADNLHGGWIPCEERLPERSYTKLFYITVRLDDGRIVTLVARWSAWGGVSHKESYDAFDCWKDVMINGSTYRMAQPIPKEKVIAWMPLPEPYKGGDMR